MANICLPSTFLVRVRLHPTWSVGPTLDALI